MGTSLNRHEFHVAMRLVALAQAGKPPTREFLMETASTPLPLPKLDGPGGWALGPSEQAKYDVLFQNEDTEGSGYLPGPKVGSILAKSGQPMDVSCG